jgi:hypothetical protein
MPYKTFHADLQALLDAPAPTQLGFIFCERLINMPVQVIPPLYRMLVEELQGANVCHFLLSLTSGQNTSAERA